MKTIDLDDQYSRLYKDVKSKNMTDGSFFRVSYRPIKKKLAYLSLFTGWVGQEEKREIRKAWLVSPVPVKTHFQLLGVPLAVIQNMSELSSYLRFGGHALISEDTVKKHWTDILNPKIVVNTYDEGYVDYDSISEKYKKRFARNQFRMEIFRRDNYQCKICGSSTDDGVHVRLEVHHVLPWEEGGVTSPENLITLCATCHAGIGKAEREILYSKIGLHFPFIKHKLFKENPDWDDTQRHSYGYILSNEVTLQLKKS